MRSNLQQSIRDHLQDWNPESDQQITYKSRFLSFVDPVYCSREHVEPGHFTASGFIRTEDFEQICLIFHPRFQKWIQPGGHLEESDESILHAAKREVLEETGLRDIDWDGTIRLDVHEVPKTSKQSAHLHYDIQLGFVADFAPLKGDVRGEWVSWSSFDKSLSDESVNRFLENWR